MARRGRKVRDHDTGELVGHSGPASVFLHDSLIVIRTTSGRRLVYSSPDAVTMAEIVSLRDPELAAHLKTAIGLARDNRAGHRGIGTVA